MLLKAYILIPFLAIIAIPFINLKWKNIILFSTILLEAGISSYFAIQSFSGEIFNYTFPGSLITGYIRIQIDSLAGWFIMIFNLVFITGSFYGLTYMKAYKDQKNNLTIHYIVMILTHAALLSICVIQNSIAFLVAWEVMAVSAFFAVIFEHEKTGTIKAGLNYLIQAHISIVFLSLGFIYVAYKTGSYDFNAIALYSSQHNGASEFALFLFFFIGFAIKAGFVPFHTWLPYAHPAAPAHISGIMSGVLIKIGIYGILRMILILHTDYTKVGYMILTFSVISGLYGVMLAIVQHNLKKLLAYHSIENIGIIGIGIGIGCIGMGSANQVLIILGFAGALLHVLNHALFKSLLFYAAGIVYQAIHTLNIEQMGGLIRKMPQTAFLFLIAAIAICGIPPFNGFISEFIIYSGLFYWIQNATLIPTIAIVSIVVSLVMIGGLAMLCFTKAFGTVFLGNPRHPFHHEIKEAPFMQRIPLYIIALFIIAIGLFPKIFVNMLLMPVSLFTLIPQKSNLQIVNPLFEILQKISWAAWGFILLIILIFYVRKFITKKRTIEVASTWGCGYVALTPKLQYTASSFVRTYSKLFSSVLLFIKKEKDIEGIFPKDAHYETRPYDKIEKWFIDNSLHSTRAGFSKFMFLSQGKLQFYILYGVIFIISVIFIPIIIDGVIYFIEFLKQL